MNERHLGTAKPSPIPDGHLCGARRNVGPPGTVSGIKNEESLETRCVHTPPERGRDASSVFGVSGGARLPCFGSTGSGVECTALELGPYRVAGRGQPRIEESG